MSSQYYKDNIDNLIEDFENLNGTDPTIKPKRLQEIINSLSQSFGLTPKTIRTWLQKAGVLHKKGTEWSDRIKRLVLEDVDKGMRIKDISKKYRGLPKSTISVWLKDLGIKAETYRVSRTLPNLKPMNINDAKEEELNKIPLLGEDLINRIINFRPISNLNDLMFIDGLGPKKLNKIKRYCYIN